MFPSTRLNDVDVGEYPLLTSPSRTVCPISSYVAQPSVTSTPVQKKASTHLYSTTAPRLKLRLLYLQGQRRQSRLKSSLRVPSISTLETPTTIPPSYQGIDDHSTNEDSPISLSPFPDDAFNDVDADDDTLSYSAVQDGTRPNITSWLSFRTSTVTFSGTPDNDDVGTHTVTVTATDLQ